jgi:hypothetical protein
LVLVDGCDLLLVFMALVVLLILDASVVASLSFDAVLLLVVTVVVLLLAFDVVPMGGWLREEELLFLSLMKIHQVAWCCCQSGVLLSRYLC